MRPTMPSDFRLPRILIDTPLGSITVEIDVVRAPRTGKNFLSYVDSGLYNDAAFCRAVRPADDPNPVKVSVVQAGLHRVDGARALESIPHKDTNLTGLGHDAGTLSMARGEIGTADSEFFIVIDDSWELDAGGGRQPDGHGFAAFGRVIAGMDVVRSISQLEQMPDAELHGELVRRVAFTAIHRLPS